MCKKCKSCKKQKKQKCVIKCVPMSTSLDTAGLTSYSNNRNIEISTNGGAGGNGGIANEFISSNYIGDEFWY